MAHFAELNSNNEVTRIIVIDNQFCLDENGNEVEQLGINRCLEIFGTQSKWVQTSYNNNFRHKYASISDIYRYDLDAFIPPQPYPSWKLNESTLEWDAPIPRPDLPQLEPNYLALYYWNEEEYQLDNTKGWILNKFRTVPKD